MSISVELQMHRSESMRNHYKEIKDPCIVQIAQDNFMMYASVGDSNTQQWKVGRFISSNMSGPWTELEPTVFHDLEGPQLCAPAVTFEMTQGEPVWTMYIQTACFEEDGVIALAISTDGLNFYGQDTSLMSKSSTVCENSTPVIGVYDVGVSSIIEGSEELQLMLFTGIRKVGSGDLYMAKKRKSDILWSEGKRILAQEDIPFHNNPNYEFFEWGLEGAKLVQLAEHCFLLIGVCFMPLPNEYMGMRQRVFFAAADTIEGPFKPIGMPFVPASEFGVGENGHPDLVIIGNVAHIIYQERCGDHQPWYLRHTVFNVDELRDFLLAKLHEDENSQQSQEHDQPSTPNHFNRYQLQM